MININNTKWFFLLPFLFDEAVSKQTRDADQETSDSEDFVKVETQEH